MKLRRLVTRLAEALAQRRKQRGSARERFGFEPEPFRGREEWGATTRQERQRQRVSEAAAMLAFQRERKKAARKEGQRRAIDLAQRRHQDSEERRREGYATATKLRFRRRDPKRGIWRRVRDAMRKATGRRA